MDIPAPNLMALQISPKAQNGDISKKAVAVLIKFQ
jgi:hypothetical protein